MAYTEPFTIVVDGVEVGSAEVITRPTSDVIDAIGNKRVQASRSGSPYELVNYEIGKMVVRWDIKDDEGRDIRFPGEISKLPAGTRRELYAYITGIVNPLLPNLGGAN